MANLNSCLYLVHLLLSRFMNILPAALHECCSGKNAKLPGYMDYLHLSTADVAILKVMKVHSLTVLDNKTLFKGSWAVLEDHVTRVGVDFFLDLINNHEEIRLGTDSVQ